MSSLWVNNCMKGKLCAAGSDSSSDNAEEMQILEELGGTLSRSGSECTRKSHSSSSARGAGTVGAGTFSSAPLAWAAAGLVL